MGKTYKDKPDKYRTELKNRRPKEKRFVSSKGREKEKLRDTMKDYEYLKC